VGRAYQYLLQLRIDEGPMSREDAVAHLRRWAAAEGVEGDGLAGDAAPAGAGE
jgi:poly(A) polymerase